MGKFKLNIENKAELEKLNELHKSIKERSTPLLQSRNQSNIQHQVLMICLARIIKYIDSIILLFHNGYGEPASCIIRSVFEGVLWMRWSLISVDNANFYFNSGKNEAMKMAQKLASRGLMYFEGTDNQKHIMELLEKELTNSSYKSWSQMARACGLSNVYFSVYPLLSAMAHGSFMFLGERLDKKSMSVDPDNYNILPFIGLARMFYRDAFNLTYDFIHNNKIHPLDEYGLFLSLGKEG